MVARAGRINATDLPDEARKNFGFNEFLKTELRLPVVPDLQHGAVPERWAAAGWVEPTGRANARPMTGFAKPINWPQMKAMGFASLNPSYALLEGRMMLGVTRRGRFSAQ
jgi:hypothetical protein